MKTPTAAFGIELMVFVAMIALSLHGSDLQTYDLRLNDKDYLEAHGLSVLLFHNSYHDVFGDQKMGGLEIILHEQRIATNGDVRLSPTPAQWDPIPHFKERKRGPSANELSAFCTYADRGLSYHVDVQPEADGFRVTVQLDQPLPAALVGKAGFNLEFLPTAYFGKSFVIDTGKDETSGIFPRHPDGPMQKDADGIAQPLPLITGHRITLSPEDPLTRVTIASDDAPLMLFDGRNQVQNGWFVVRSLIPSGKSGGSSRLAYSPECCIRVDAFPGRGLQPGRLHPRADKSCRAGTRSLI